jgi:hypothetical protein
MSLSLSLSKHADTRNRQRGVSDALLQALIDYADCESPVGNGCSVLRVTRRALDSREVRASLGAQADRLGSLVAVVSCDGNIVTVLHDKAGPTGRRYRRRH